MIGLTLNESIELITSDHEVVLAVRNILPSVTHVDPRDAIVLGAPVGSDATLQVESFGADDSRWFIVVWSIVRPTCCCSEEHTLCQVFGPLARSAKHSSH